MTGRHEACPYCGARMVDDVCSDSNCVSRQIATESAMMRDELFSRTIREGLWP